MVSEPTVDLNAVLAHYDLGELAAQSRDQRGTVNTSFAIELVKDGRRSKYFLRRYRHGIGVEEILFEHTLIEHVSRQGTCPIAQVQRTRHGSTFLELPGGDASQPLAYFAIFDFLPGEDRYTWVGPQCTPGELHNAGDLLARFHAAVRSLQPAGRRAEPSIIELLPVISDKWAGAPGLSKGTEFDDCVADHFSEVQASIVETLSALRDPGIGSFPELIIHSDYHPGNLKFEGEEISGLVDFDWAKVDLRAFDVGLAAWYFCASWEQASDGALRLRDLGTFVSAYQARLSASRELTALGADELQLLPDLIQAGNVYILYWTLRDYFCKQVNPAEYLVYLKHNLHSSRWLQSADNRRQVQALLAELPAG